jgi:hypothetical protein
MTSRQQSGFLRDSIGSYIPKDRRAELQYGVDWADWLDAGDTLTTSTFTIENSDASISLVRNPILSGVAYATITGGTTGTIYTVRCDISTTAGYDDTRRFRIKIEDRYL